VTCENDSDWINCYTLMNGIRLDRKEDRVG